MPVDPISAAELRSMLRRSERSGGYLARKLNLSRTTVARWMTTGGVPDKHVARVRQLLPPAPR